MSFVSANPLYTGAAYPQDVESAVPTANEVVPTNVKRKIALGSLAIGAIVGASIGAITATALAKPNSTFPNGGPGENVAEASTFEPVFKVPELCTPAQLAVRQNELATMKTKMNVSRRTLNSNPGTKDGISSKNYNMPAGPLPIPDTLAFNMVYGEAARIENRLTEDKINIPESIAALPLTSLADYDAYYRALADSTRLDLPVRMRDIDHEGSDYNEDEEFADRALNMFSRYMTKCTELPCVFDFSTESGLSTAQINQLLSKYNVYGGYEFLVAQGRVFNLDVMHAADYKDEYGAPDKYSPGGQMIMITDYDGKIWPIAAKLSNGLVYTSFDSANEWRLAKMAVSCAAGNFIHWNHFIDTHMILESVRGEMLRHVSNKHPITPLLEHHFEDIFGWTIAGANSLLKRNTEFDQVFGFGAEGGLQYLEESTSSFEYKTFEDDIESRGLDRLKNFNYYGDAKAIKSAIRTMVEDYIFAYYMGSSGVEEDVEIQNWAAAIATHVQGMPSSFESESDLSEFISEIIFRVTVEHHTQNQRIIWDALLATSTPPAFWKPLPTEKGDVDLVSFLPNDMNESSTGGRSRALQYFGLAQTFSSIPLQEDARLGNSYATLSNLELSHPIVASAVDNFKSRLNMNEQHIEWRNKVADKQKGTYTYNFAQPAKLPFNVWV